jgi:hypothetical protein
MAFVVERDMKRCVLDFKAVEEGIFVLRIKTKFHNVSPITVHFATGETGSWKRRPSVRK